MLTTPHAIAGAAIGSLSHNPWLVVPMAIASHFILDSVPHWQETLAPYQPTRKTYIRIPIDLVLAVGLVALAAKFQPDYTATIWLGAAMANAPDIDSILVLTPQYNKGLIKLYWDWHCRIQRETASLWGLAPQLFVMGAGLVTAWRGGH